jgi:DNA-binding transcriptional LysR family regulator
VNFRTLDLNLLRVFDAVMLERNVTRAAEVLAMTQPAASNALRRLREALGEDLFDTSPTGVTPTPRATALWPAVRLALGTLRDELDSQDFDPSRDERRFRLQMADATAVVQVQPLIEQMIAGPWRVGLSIEPLNTRDPRPQLDRGFADAAVGFFPDVARRLAAEGGSSEFVLDPMYECEYVAVMRRSHPLARADALTLSDYVGADHVRVSFAGRAHGFVDEALSRLNLSRRVVMVVGHFATASQALRHADWLSVLPRSYVDVSDNTGDMVVRDLPFAMPRIEVGLLWHRRHERDAAHRWLRQTVTRCVPHGCSTEVQSIHPLPA